jgi:hypothetical protein
LIAISKWVRFQAEAEEMSLDAYIERERRRTEERRQEQLLAPDIRGYF